MLTPRKSRRVGSSLVENSARDSSGGVPVFKDTILLIHANGSNLGKNVTWIDSSTNNFGITYSISGSNSRPAQGTFSPFAVTGWSCRLPGQGNPWDWLIVPASSAFAFGTDDFTIECFIRLSNLGTQNAIIGDYKTSTGLNFLFYVTSSTINFSHTGGTVSKSYSFSFDRWYHVAVSRQSSTLRFFVDGTQVSTSDTVTTNIANSNSVLIGANNDGASFPIWQFEGFISNLRVTKGEALYTSAFTKPINELSVGPNTSFLTCVDQTLRDLGPNQLAISFYRTGTRYDNEIPYNATLVPYSPFDPNFTYSAARVGGSTYFNDNYLTVDASSVWDFGSSNFTIECWIYRESDFTGGLIQHNYSGSFNYQLMITSSNKVTFTYNSGAALSTPTDSILRSRWIHVAVVRNASDLSIYVNGVSVASTTAANILADTSPSTLVIGNGFRGWISCVQITQTARYTANFPLAVTPLTATVDTELLLNFTNSTLIDSTGRNNLIAIGEPATTTSFSVTGGSSIIFGGTFYLTDIITNAFRPSFTENWTVEFWLYPISTATQGVFMFATEPPTNRGFGFFISSPGRPAIASGSGITFGNVIGNSTDLPQNQWSYISLVKEGSTVSLFINGGTAKITATLNPVVDGTYYMWIGDGLGGGGGALNNLTGTTAYMDEFRYTKGVARYSYSASVPSEFPDK